MTFLCVCPLIDDKFRHILKVNCGTTRLPLRGFQSITRSNNFQKIYQTHQYFFKCKQRKSWPWRCWNIWPNWHRFSRCYFSDGLLLSVSFDWEDKSNKKDRVWPHFQRLLEVRQKYSTSCHIFNSFFGVWKCVWTRSFVFDILRLQGKTPQTISWTFTFYRVHFFFGKKSLNLNNSEKTMVGVIS